MGESGQAGRRVFLLEDEGGVALLIEDMLEDLGFEVVVSAARLSRALEAAASVPFDVAILDVNVGGDSSLELAHQLAERNIPFLFSTGYGNGGLPPEFQQRPVLTKPFGLPELRRALAEAIGQDSA